MVTFVGATTDATAGGTVFTNTTAPVAPMPAGIAANDVAVVSVCFFGASTTVTLTGYTSQLDNTGTASDHRIVFTKLLTGSETSVAPVMSAATWGTLEVLVLRGLASATPNNKVSQATSFASGGGSFTNPSLTIASSSDATVYGYPATATGNSSANHPAFTATPASLSNWSNDTTSGTTAGATQGIGWGVNVSSPGTATVNIPGPTTGSGLAWALDFTAGSGAPVLPQPGGQVYRRRFRRAQQPYALAASPLVVPGYTSQPGLAVPGLFTPGSPASLSLAALADSGTAADALGIMPGLTDMGTAADGPGIMPGLTDTGSASEALAVTAAVPLADAGAAADAVAITQPVSLGDAGAASDALGVMPGLTEAGAGSDNLGIMPGLADSGSASEALLVALVIALTETGSGSDSPGIMPGLADTGAGDGTLGIVSAVPLADTGASADALGITQPVPLADTGAATDSPGIMPGLTETAAADGALAVSQAVAVSLADTGTGSGTLGVMPGLAEPGAGDGSLAVQVITGLPETGQGSDGFTLASAAVALAEQGAGLDGLAPGITLALAEQGTGLDRLTAGSGPIFTVGILAGATSSGVNEPATYAPTGAAATSSGVNTAVTSP